MGKADRTRQQRARERIAAQQAAAKRAETRRRALIAGGSALVVIAIVAGLVIAKVLQKAPVQHAASARSIAAVAREITTVPASVLDAVGKGPTGQNAVDPLAPITGQPPLTMNGKPEVLYIGAEYCPYCAAERWALAEALSRFGTFTGLHFIHSSSDDIYSNTATLTFYNSTYTSKYLTFRPVETTTVTKAPLQQPTSAENALLDKYTQGAFPFVDVGNKYAVTEAQYFPSVLGSLPQVSPGHIGLSWSQIAADMRDPSSPVGEAIIGAANHIAAAICKITNNKPGSVCTAPAVTAVSGSI